MTTSTPGRAYATSPVPPEGTVATVPSSRRENTARRPHSGRGNPPEERRATRTRERGTQGREAREISWKGVKHMDSRLAKIQRYLELSRMNIEDPQRWTPGSYSQATVEDNGYVSLDKYTLMAALMFHRPPPFFLRPPAFIRHGSIRRDAYKLIQDAARKYERDYKDVLFNGLANKVSPRTHAQVLSLFSTALEYFDQPQDKYMMRGDLRTRLNRLFNRHTYLSWPAILTRLAITAAVVALISTMLIGNYHSQQRKGVPRSPKVHSRS
jgi:hypothetical protein